MKDKDLNCQHVQLPQDLGVHHSKIVVDGLVEDHVVDVSVYDFAIGPQTFDSVDIDVLEHLVYLWRSVRHL